MTIEVNSFQVNSVSTNNANFNKKVAFKGTDNQTKNDTVEISTKKNELSTGAKVGIGIGIAGVIALAVGLLMKGKFSKAKDAINNPDAQQSLQQKFNAIFNKNFSETEINGLITKYKEIFKIDNAESFAKKLFEQMKKDSGNGNKDIEIVVHKCKPGKARQGGFGPQQGKLHLDVECENDVISNDFKKFIFGALAHEFKHVRQYEIAYHTDWQRFLKAMTKPQDRNEVIAFMEDALENNPALVNRCGGEDACKEAIAGLKANDPDYISAYCEKSEEEIKEIIKNIKKLFGPVKQYDPNSKEYKMGIKYLENWENYIQPTQETMTEYTQQIVEKEAFENEYLAEEIIESILS